ncbi:MAG: hypothetical protein JWN03_7855 [Nocardia sp.]|uniref:hypothetical protein n=1 Tax=Nocardia sp. TaxID=1821 RepID=UPI002638270D|nr:hypothetical protein [Nocardia sp.]MCU1647580.1 hypothetical protein [Nocardia sp.]
MTTDPSAPRSELRTRRSLFGAEVFTVHRSARGNTLVISGPGLRLDMHPTAARSLAGRIADALEGFEIGSDHTALAQEKPWPPL